MSDLKPHATPNDFLAVCRVAEILAKQDALAGREFNCPWSEHMPSYHKYNWNFVRAFLDVYWKEYQRQRDIKKRHQEVDGVGGGRGMKMGKFELLQYGEMCAKLDYMTGWYYKHAAEHHLRRKITGADYTWEECEVFNQTYWTTKHKLSLMEAILGERPI